MTRTRTIRFDGNLQIIGQFPDSLAHGAQRFSFSSKICLRFRSHLGHLFGSSKHAIRMIALLSKL